MLLFSKGSYNSLTNKSRLSCETMFKLKCDIKNHAFVLSCIIGVSSFICLVFIHVFTCFSISHYPLSTWWSLPHSPCVCEASFAEQETEGGEGFGRKT